MEDISNYEKIKEDTRRFYHTIGKVHSPALQDLVHFPSESFNHLIYKGARKEREKAEQISRFKLLPRAVMLLKQSTTYQEFEETLKEFDLERHGKRVKETKVVRYWGLIAIIESRKIKVIVRQIGDGGLKHFWSVIPAWVTNKYRDLKFATTMKGDPEAD